MAIQRIIIKISNKSVLLLITTVTTIIMKVTLNTRKLRGMFIQKDEKEIVI